MTTTGGAPPTISGGGANPLARLQAEETGGGEWLSLSIASSYERVADAWMTSSEATVVVLQLSGVMVG